MKRTKSKSKVLGILSLIFSIVGVLTCCCYIGVLFAFIALVLGIIGCIIEEKNELSIAGTVISSVVVIIFIVILALGGIGAITEQFESESDTTIETTENNNNAIQETTTEEIIEITSTELIDAFNENQVKCSKLYDKKKIKVTGTVQNVGTDILNNIYVCLGHDTEFTFVGIQCYAKNKDVENQIAELKEGDIITVIGIGSCGSLSFSLEKAEIITE